MTKLSAARVHAIMMDVLFKPDEIPADKSLPANAVVAEGIQVKFGFHKERLERHRAEMIEMLGDLPDEFHEGKGGGWSFLNACNTRDGEQWADLHKTVNELFCLAIALGLAKWLMPRELWGSLPGGMPYVVVTLPK